MGSDRNERARNCRALFQTPLDPTRRQEAGRARKSPDSIWTAQGEAELASYRNERPGLEYWIRPDIYRVVRLDRTALKGVLGGAPVEVLGTKPS